MTRTLLLICQANIVRSPAAELIARAWGADGGAWTVASAGVRALREEPIDPAIGTALGHRGIQARGHRSRQCDVAMIREAELVLAFESTQRAWALQQCPAALRSTFTIRRAARLLAAKPRRAEPLAYLALDEAAYEPDDDFADPFGQGDEAADQAVGEIERLLRVVLPALGVTDRPPPVASPAAASRRAARGLVVAPAAGPR